MVLPAPLPGGLYVHTQCLRELRRSVPEPEQGAGQRPMVLPRWHASHFHSPNPVDAMRLREHNVELKAYNGLGSNNKLRTATFRSSQTPVQISLQQLGGFTVARRSIFFCWRMAWEGTAI